MSKKYFTDPVSGIKFELKLHKPLPIKIAQHFTYVSTIDNCVVLCSCPNCRKARSGKIPRWYTKLHGVKSRRRVFTIKEYRSLGGLL